MGWLVIGTWPSVWQAIGQLAGGSTSSWVPDLAVISLMVRGSWTHHGIGVSLLLLFTPDNHLTIQWAWEVVAPAPASQPTARQPD